MVAGECGRAQVILGHRTTTSFCDASPEEQVRAPGQLEHHRQSHRPNLRGPRVRGYSTGHGPPPDQGLGRRLRPNDVRPGLHEHGRLSERHHVHRRRPGHPALPRLSHRAAGRAVDLSRGGVPPDRGRAADQDAAPRVDGSGEVPHLRPHQHHQVPRGVPLRRPPHGCPARRGGGAVHLLPRRQGHPRPREPQAAAGPAAGQGAHHCGVRLPPLPRAADRVPRQRTRLHREFRQHDLQHRRPPQAEEGAAARARDPAHPPRRPRAELLHQRGARRRLVACGPLLGRLGRDRGPLRTAPRRGQRGRARHAGRDRGQEEHPGVHQGGEGWRRPADGLRPPGVQVLRPAGQADQAGRRRRVPRDRAQSEAGDRHGAGADRAGGRVLHQAEALPQRGLLLRPDLPGDGLSDRVLHRALRPGPDAGVAGSVGGDAAGQGPEDRPAAADLHRQPERPFVPIEKRG